jgi:hypothetical protein
VVGGPGWGWAHQQRDGDQDNQNKKANDSYKRAVAEDKPSVMLPSPGNLVGAIRFHWVTSPELTLTLQAIDGEY